MMHFSRTTAPAAIAKVNVDVGAARTFTLNQVPGVSDITSFFQFYRIDSVDITYYFTTPNISGNVPFPRIITAFSPETGSTPTSIDAVTSYSSCRQFQLGTSRVTYTRTIKPRPLVSSNSQTGVVVNDAWCNTNSGNIPHYGLLEWLQPYNTVINTNMSVDYSVRYNFTCKGAR